MASMYCRKFIVPEIKEYCGTERDRDILNLKIAFISQKLNLFDFDDLVEGIHYFGCKKENLNKEMFSAVQFLNNLDIPRCPCNNSIYSHYYGKMEKCLTKDNVAFSSEYLSSQRLQNKRSFFLTLQKSNNTLFVKNPKQYSWR
ncbi:hypothetical protein BgiBS90_020358 [Biomphalaria glabrata]|nr:hypothetical protein BgiBS90_020358 [Biomphalaria glabrata]